MTSTILGPVRPLAIDGVRFDDLGDAVRFAEPGVHASIAVGDLLDPELLGFAFTQFAMPVRAAAGRPFDFAPAANLRSPPVVIPLVIRDSSGRVCLLVPLDAWHEQVTPVAHGEASSAIRRSTRR